VLEVRTELRGQEVDPPKRTPQVGRGLAAKRTTDAAKCCTRSGDAVKEPCVNIRGEVHAYLAPEDYRRLRLEALARGVSLSRCAGDCLAEYFALRREMATALEAETLEQLRTLAPSRVIHVLLAQTEQRLVATIERYGEALEAVRAELAAVLAMLDRSAFTCLYCTPEAPPTAQARALMSGERRFAHWRRAVTRMLTASGRSVPWPLPDSEQADQPVSPMLRTGDTTEDLKAADRPGRIGVEGPAERQNAPTGSSGQVPLATPGGLRARLTHLVRRRREPAAGSSPPQL
jgi:hypothetical protein